MSQTFLLSAGYNLNFDLAYPSEAIPNNFFPSDVATYGYTVSPCFPGFF